MGEILLKVSAVCHPCDQLEELRPGLKREMRGRRGMLCRVVQGGTIRPGDSIEKFLTNFCRQNAVILQDVGFFRSEGT